MSAIASVAANAFLFVVQHDRSATGFADAQFQRTVGVLVVERHALQRVGAGHVQVAMIEEDDVRGWLTGDAFANRAVASVVVDRILIGTSSVVGAATGIFLCHGTFPLY